VNVLSLAMSKAEQDAEKEAQDRTRDKTPQQVEKAEKETPVIGSSSTWKQEEVDHFNVKIEKNIDVRRMIPQKFFTFDHLERYTHCCPYMNDVD
jgi:hypothetical protein